MSPVRPIKKLGQHFLRDTSLARKIVESAEIGPDDVIIEIGPGEGTLTRPLMDSSAGNITAIEIDSRMSDILNGLFGADERFKLVQEDILKVDLNTVLVGPGKVRIFGNLPFYITSPILFRLLEFRENIQDIYITVQKEVAERLASEPGRKAYGIPSVLYQAFSEVRILFDISRKAFFPVPQVDAAVLQIRFLEKPVHAIDDEDLFRAIVRKTFGQRRKMLRNTLKGDIGPEELCDIVDLTQRPEELSVIQFIKLTNYLSEKIHRRLSD
ncbi:ribosomal RNA small subunit methyltransferase A [bacterium I07]|nr:ribosomal RNA small subunit methyltransferase A [bacterium I07]